MPTNPLYPSLSSLITLDELPEELGFLQTGLNTVFDDLFYRDLLISKTVKDDTTTYQLIVISYKKIGIDIPGTGFSIVLNPSHVNPGDQTEFPVTVEYELPILSLVREFNLQNFSFQPKDIFDILLEITQIDDGFLILNTVNNFIVTASPFNDFVDNVNSSFSLTGSNQIPYPSGLSLESDAEEIAEAIRTNSSLIAQQITALEVVFDLYLDNIN